MEQPTQPQVDPEVRALLDGHTADEPKQPTAGDVFGKPQAEPPRLTAAVPPQWDQNRMKDQEETPPWDVWTKEVANLGKVTVSESEKTLFLKAAMHDADVVFPISMPGNMIVTVRANSIGRLRAISQAMSLDEKDGIIFNDTLWGIRLQYYSLLLQIVGVGDQPGLLPDSVDIDSMTSSALCEWMRGNVDDILAPCSAARYALLVQAVRIFEVKLARCKEGLLNNDFFVSADTPS